MNLIEMKLLLHLSYKLTHDRKPITITQATHSDISEEKSTCERLFESSYNCLAGEVTVHPTCFLSVVRPTSWNKQIGSMKGKQTQGSEYKFKKIYIYTYIVNENAGNEICRSSVLILEE